VEFPFPAWATRLSESAGEPARASVSAGAGAGNGVVRDPLRRLPVVDDPPPF